MSGLFLFNVVYVFLNRILIYYDGVEMGFDMPGNMPHFKGNKKGRVYLTTHRVSFDLESLFLARALLGKCFIKHEWLLDG